MGGLWRVLSYTLGMTGDSALWRLFRARNKRHSFAVRALEASPDSRQRIAEHMLALSTYLGHSKVSHTYWYLEATPELMEGIARRWESFVTGGQP